MIDIIDYGVGNIEALINAYRILGYEAKRVRTADDLRSSSKLILPGVGSFDYAMNALEQSGMHNLLRRLISEDEIPILGICVGMQMLGSLSDEGVSEGLGLIPGHIRRIDFRDSCNLPLPHMGWNELNILNDSPLFTNIPNNSRFYFLHSYYFDPFSADHAIAEVCYGNSFTCAISNKNIFGVQFHPEKSHDTGLRLLSNFAVI